jgi:hypothetical protein
MGGALSPMGKVRNVYKIFVGKPEGKEPRGRTKRRGRIILE